VDHAHIRVRGHDLSQRRQQSLIQLDGDHVARRDGEMPGERPEPRADLEDAVAGRKRRRGHDPAQRALIDEEILAQRLAWAQAMAAEQIGDGERRERGHGMLCGINQAIEPAAGVGVRK